MRNAAIDPDIVVSDSATNFSSDPAGKVAVTASHGGVYPAHLLAKHRVRAAFFNDAGVGRDNAGIGGLDHLQSLGIPSATVSHTSARIGYGDDSLNRGVISYANALARAFACIPGMPCLAAAKALCAAPRVTPDLPLASEARQVVIDGPVRVICLDSASLVSPEDAGHIMVTGSHGGLPGGRAALALRYDALAALYNDAGIGLENAGISRLSALDDRGVAAATVASSSARIGDAMSTYGDGVISACNAAAASYGARVGMAAKMFVDLLLKAKS